MTWWQIGGIAVLILAGALSLQLPDEPSDHHGSSMDL